MMKTTGSVSLFDEILKRREDGTQASPALENSKVG
jgi:hypothetical protein